MFISEMQDNRQLPTPTIVTDNAASEKKAAEITDWSHFGCYHHINLIVKHSLEIPEMSYILESLISL